MDMIEGEEEVVGRGGRRVVGEGGEVEGVEG